MPEQQPKQAGAKESRSKAAEQPAPEQSAGARRRLAKGAGSSGLRDGALNRSCGIGRGWRCRRRRKGAHAAAAAREPATGASMGISSYKNERGRNRSNRKQKTAPKHGYLPRQISGAEDMHGQGNL
jgi:hypothetical protein